MSEDTVESREGGTMSEDAVEGSGTPEAETILRVEQLEKHFGGITAVDGASFEIERGTLTGLIGPNGAGKSTTFNCITGMHTPDSGSVTFDGVDITGMEPNEVAQSGLGRTFQIPRELAEMTVLENLLVAPKNQRGETLWRAITPGFRSAVEREEAALLEEARETLEFFDIGHLAEERAGSLSGGQRKLLELARVLMTDPDMVLLDEPFAGVNPTLESKLIEHIHRLRGEGYTFLIVEHDMEIIMENCERVLVMHQGDILADGTPAEIQANERVVEAYLGGELE